MSDYDFQQLARETGKQIHRVDLAAIRSKYIGETEKNLDALFTQAQQNNWILLFDEGDALFGKRTSVQDSHDKYANQEVSYLLQKMEKYRDHVIVAVKDKSKIDPDLLKRLAHYLRP